MPQSERAQLLRSLSSATFCEVLLAELDELDEKEEDDELRELHDLYCGVRVHRYLGGRSNVERSDAHQRLVFDLRDDEFMKSLRVTKHTFEFVWQLIRGDARFEQRGTKPQRDVSIQLAVALEWFGACGNGNSNWRIVRHYGVGAGTVSAYVKRVRRALLRHYCTFVRWPPLHEREVTSAFHRERYGLPGVIGMVDVVCNEDKCILMVYTGWPGSCADSTVFSKSPVLQRPARYFVNDQYLLGDSGYAVSRTVITPYKKPAALEADSKAFNDVHCSARVVVENTIGRWKNRWMSLKGIRTQIRKKKDFAVVNNHVLACAMLHNIGLELDDIWTDESNSDAEDDSNNALDESASLLSGFNKREQLKHALLRSQN